MWSLSYMGAKEMIALVIGGLLMLKGIKTYWGEFKSWCRSL